MWPNHAWKATVVHVPFEVCKQIREHGKQHITNTIHTENRAIHAVVFAARSKLIRSLISDLSVVVLCSFVPSHRVSQPHKTRVSAWLWLRTTTTLSSLVFRRRTTFHPLFCRVVILDGERGEGSTKKGRRVSFPPNVSGSCVYNEFHALKIYLFSQAFNFFDTSPRG